MPAKAAKFFGGSMLVMQLHWFVSRVFLLYGFLLFTWWVPVVVFVVQHFLGGYLAGMVQGGMGFKRSGLRCTGLALVSWALMAATVMLADTSKVLAVS